MKNTKNNRNYVTVNENTIKETAIQSLFCDKEGNFYSRDTKGWYTCTQYFNKGTGDWKCNGYWKVRFNNKLYMAHVLIAKTFIPGWKPGICVDHIDNNSANNNVENLQYLTRAQNSKKFWTDVLTKDATRLQKYKETYSAGIKEAHKNGAYKKHLDELHENMKNRGEL